VEQQNKERSTLSTAGKTTRGIDFRLLEAKKGMSEGKRSRTKEPSKAGEKRPKIALRGKDIRTARWRWGHECPTDAGQSTMGVRSVQKRTVTDEI